MKVRNVLVAVVAVACVGLISPSAWGQSGSLQNNLFSQYETPPGASMATAGMYPAPHYVPRNVGATHYTYQALQPHEMMYTHVRKYYNLYGGPENFYANQCNGRGGGAGINETTVIWQNGGQHLGNFPFASAGNRLARFKYCGRGGSRGFARGGCASGNCGDGGCQSGACSANLSDGNLNR